MDTDATDDLAGESTAAGQVSPLLLTPEQAATCLAICRTKLYELLRRGELESVQIGSSRRRAWPSTSSAFGRSKGR
jgi:excisionase family DNA binding protein